MYRCHLVDLAIYVRFIFYDIQDGNCWYFFIVGRGPKFSIV